MPVGGRRDSRFGQLLRRGFTDPTAAERLLDSPALRPAADSVLLVQGLTLTVTTDGQITAGNVVAGARTLVPALPGDLTDAANIPALPVLPGVPSVPAGLPTLPVTSLPTVPADLPTVPADLPTVPADLPAVPADLPTVPADLPTADELGAELERFLAAENERRGRGEG